MFLAYSGLYDFNLTRTNEVSFLFLLVFKMLLLVIFFNAANVKCVLEAETEPVIRG